jgi:DNA-binding PadR family transcriptional regulator
MRHQFAPDERSFARHQHPPFGPGGPRHRRGHRRGRRGRMARGDVRTAILLLLDEEPMHGYQLMQAIADRTGGRWTPSPGAVYPAINLLEDEGLVISHADSGRKVIELTDQGRATVAENKDSWTDPFADDEEAGPDLRNLVMQLGSAARQVVMTGSPTQVDEAARILSEARRSLYLLLADGPQDTAAAES